MFWLRSTPSPVMPTPAMLDNFLAVDAALTAAQKQVHQLRKQRDAMEQTLSEHRTKHLRILHCGKLITIHKPYLRKYTSEPRYTIEVDVVDTVPCV